LDMAVPLAEPAARREHSGTRERSDPRLRGFATS
jgi:hypothetical protein